MRVKGPKSLYFRFLLITIIPVILIQIITTYIFYERHWDSLSRNMISSLAGEVNMIVSGLEHTQANERADFIIKTTNYLGLNVTINNNENLLAKGNVDKEYPDLIETLKYKIKSGLHIYNDEDGRLKLMIQSGTDVITIVFNEKRIINPSTYIFILWVFGSAILLMLIAILFLRIQVRSILNLTKAAEGFGKGGDLHDFKPSGAAEIRRAGIAFIEMKERIKRLIDTRTQMLAGVSHDLRTPLTRMKLITAMFNDKNNRDQIEDEVNEMNKMIDGYLSFARMDSPHQFVRRIESLNLKAFISEVVGKYRNFPNKINVDIADNIFINIRPEYFARSISNIIDNSMKYAGNLEISAGIDEHNAYITFDDDGPGIPDDRMEEVFQPFHRIDESRNSDTGGVGLGLSISRDIINKHGGDIKLAKSPLGGLRSTIVLPR